MLLLKKKKDKESEDQGLFTYTSKYITDELELIQDQQDNLIKVSEELEKAFSQTDKMKRFFKILKKIDETILKNIEERRKEESSMINLLEDIKQLVKKKKYEDLEKLMLLVQNKSKLKIRLSQEEMNTLRQLMNQIYELYKESSGLCRLYQLVYSNIRQIYDKCAEEIGTELTEEEELSRAGAYRERIHRGGE
ncbi:hypothetical protein AYK26_01125 [Euryarchaeota archaeon SM23-78]|nr:MAG: hypothetical protein AYK26_01125 [Euryarchaeota archaeon SM23-78]MBW3001224.1 hypothetical protein [Candidatus Woesearchaeota archaeon]